MILDARVEAAVWSWLMGSSDRGGGALMRLRRGGVRPRLPPTPGPSPTRGEGVGEGRTACVSEASAARHRRNRSKARGAVREGRLRVVVAGVSNPVLFNPLLPTRFFQPGQGF